MKKDTVIKVEHVSKKFCKSLKRSMVYGVTDIAKNAIGLKSNSQKLRKDEFWAVHDVSFEVKRGETLGIIGPNGSGKTTLLKMLNGIFWPDKGKITIKGRVGALIAVGAGFHPLMTGRENIYINASILGMSKREIDRKFDEIVEFADIGDFIDSPVKTYSSGMYVRLGFAIAVHCEPEVLLVDEVLSVGDASFQSKSYQKIQELVNNKSTTIFISHNMDAIRRICDKVIFLSKNKVLESNKIDKVILEYEKSMYLNLNENIKNLDKKNSDVISRRGTGEIKITKVELLDKNNEVRNKFKSGEKIVIKIHYIVRKSIKSPIFLIGIRNYDSIYCVEADSEKDNFVINSISGEGCIKVTFKNFNLSSGRYFISTAIRYKGAIDYLDILKHAFSFYIESPYHQKGLFYINRSWEKIT